MVSVVRLLLSARWWNGGNGQLDGLAGRWARWLRHQVENRLKGLEDVSILSEKPSNVPASSSTLEHGEFPFGVRRFERRFQGETGGRFCCMMRGALLPLIARKYCHMDQCY